MSRITQGIITGCDANQEWMLVWWWESLRKHNNYPVCFFDFGMSEAARKWCEKRGEVRPLALLPFQIASEKDVDPIRREQWEQRIGTAIWLLRISWVKKLLAILYTPFEHGLWLDLDCEVRGSLELIFNHLRLGASLIMKPSCEEIQQADQQLGWLESGEITYNSGVVGFRSDASILQAWAEEVRLHNDLYPGNEQALSRVIWRAKWPVIHLPCTYNWNPLQEKVFNPIIIHYAGGLNKVVLRERIISKGCLFTESACLE